jgi:hypothetical protein
LIVDLLDNKVDASSVSGVLVYNAHRYRLQFVFDNAILYYYVLI